MSTTTKTRVRYTGHADAVKLATWMPRFQIDSVFDHDGIEWFLDVELPQDARIEYRIDIERDGRWESILDPLNPVTATNPFGHNSVLTGAGYQPPSWLAEPLQRPGSVSELRVRSAILGGRRSVHLYRPNAIPNTAPLPLLFVFDGSDYRNHAAITRCFDRLIESRSVSPFRAVLSDPRRRLFEYTASPDHAAAMLTEVLPYVSIRVAVSGLAALGASLGAVAAWNIAQTSAEPFVGVMLQSGTFARSPHPELDDRMLTEISSFIDSAIADPLEGDVAIHQSCGRYESLIDWNRDVALVLGSSRHRYRFTETWAGHDWGAWRDQLEPGLRMVFPPDRAQT